MRKPQDRSILSNWAEVAVDDACSRLAKICAELFFIALFFAVIFIIFE